MELDGMIIRSEPVQATDCPTMSSRRQPIVANAAVLYRPKTPRPPSNNRWLFWHIRLRSSL